MFIKRKSVFITVFAMAASSLVTLKLTLPVTKDEQAIQKLQNHITQLEQEKKRITQENHALQQQLLFAQKPATLPVVVAAEKTAVPAATKIPPQPEVQVEDRSRVFEEKNRQFISWWEKSVSSAGFNLATSMQQRFDAEKVDTYWAAAQEEKLRNIFIHDKSLAGVALKNAQCRTTQCQLAIGITDLNQANALAEKVTAILQAENSPFMIIATPDPQQGLTTLYLSKDENSFEFN